MIRLVVLFVLLIVGPKAKAYITFLNGRIDHALYDGHDPKLVVAGKIGQVVRFNADTSSFVFEGPEFKEISFTVNTVIMGDGKHLSQTLIIPISSFTWPNDLVELKQDAFCIFILREYKNDDPHFQIEVVIPAIESAAWVAQPIFNTVQSNNSAKNFLETELLAVLKTELKTPQIRETLLLLGPVLQKENIGQIEKWIEYKNDWVIRVALADIVYASQSERHLKYLARNINIYFTTHKENALHGESDDFKNYSPYYVYFTYVFFLDPEQRNTGSQWDDKESIKNKELALKLKATGLLSKWNCKKLEI